MSADAFTAYRGIDAGTAKPTVEERRGVPHHLVDIKDPSDPFSAGEFARLARAASREILSRGKLPILCGGTGSTSGPSSRGSSWALRATNGSGRPSGSSRSGMGRRGSSGPSGSSTPRAGHGSRNATGRVPFATSRSPFRPGAGRRTSFARGPANGGRDRP
ncbi:MAG: hypothetical protein IPF66_08655 [Holophagales bacterium]|nr:hypothetical protein [Holophagales bacterium]